MKFKIVGGILLFIVVMFLLELGGLGWSRFFGPKWENVRRKTFEETKSYNEGKEQDLLRYRLEYLRADSLSDKESLASTIRHMFADYDASRLSPELRTFLTTIRSGGVI